MRNQDKRDLFAAELARTGDVKVAAAAVGIKRSAAGEWRKDPAIRAAVREQRGAALVRAAAQLSEGFEAAAQTLIDIMKDEGNAAQVRVNAAAALLSHGVKLCETLKIDELSERIEALEQARQEAAG